MANLAEQANYPDGIYQLETTDPVVGGPEGVSNIQAKQLANRTAWLKAQVEQLLAELNAIGIEDVADLQAVLDGKAAASALTRHADNPNAHGTFAPLADYNRTQEAQDTRLTTLQNTTEKRHVQTITIAGSTDYLYPVFWQFPDNRFGVGKLEISRHYVWDHPVLSAGPYHAASLLLQIEGNDTPWGGDAEYLKVLKYFWQYNKTASHLRYGGYAQREKIDALGAAMYGLEDTNYTHSGIYLRGGGLRYRFSSNWPIRLVRLENEDRAGTRAVLYEYNNTRWYVQRIPFTALEDPTED